MRNFINTDSGLNLWPLWPLDTLSWSSIHPLCFLTLHLAILPLLVLVSVFLPWPEGLLPRWKGAIHINCQCWLPSLWSSRKERRREWHEMRERIWEEQQDRLFYLPWLLETADQHVPEPSRWDLLPWFALSAFTRLLGEERKWFQHMEWFTGPRHAWNRTGKEPRTADKSLRWRDLMRMRCWDAFGRLDKVEGD